MASRFLCPLAPLARLRDVAAFLFLAGPVACVVSASIGTLTLHHLRDLQAEDLAFNWFTWYTCDTLSVLVLTPVLFFLFALGSSWGRFISIAVPLGVAATLFIGSYLLYQKFAARKATEHFLNAADDLRDHLVVRLGQTEERLRAIGGLISASEEVTADEFAFFNHTFKPLPGLESREWVPRVAAERRAAFETLTDTSILDRGPGGRLQPAARRQEYMPVKLVYPPNDPFSIPGLDLLPANRQAIARAQATGRRALTAELHGDKVSWRLLVPVYEAGDSQVLRGVAVTLLNVPHLLADLAREADRAGIGLRLRGLAPWHPDVPLLTHQVPLKRAPDWTYDLNRNRDLGAGPGLLWLNRLQNKTAPICYLIATFIEPKTKMA